MRRFASVAVLATSCIVAACGHSATTPAPPGTASATTRSDVNPANITRVRADLPPGYEVTNLVGPVSPVAFWGLAPGWAAEPAQCGALAGPAGEDAATKGWSASGSGGIVHAAVVAPVAFDPSVLADCAHWTVTSGNTTGTVDVVDAPSIEGAATVGMATVAKTVVEGGMETTSTASTFMAYLDDHLAFVTAVSDPGSPNPALGQEFAADLLVKTVSALRG